MSPAWTRRRLRAPNPRRLLPSARAVSGALALAGALLIAAWPVWQAVTQQDEPGEQTASANAADTVNPEEDRNRIDSSGPERNSEPAETDVGDSQGHDAPGAPIAAAGPQEGNDAPPGPTRAADNSVHDAVVPATYLAEEDDSPEQLVLDTQTPYRVERLTLQPGQRVCGRGGGRVQIEVPAAGLRITLDAAGPQGNDPIYLEDIDFICNRTGQTGAAMVVVEAGTVRFERCTFCGPGEFRTEPVAVRWVHPSPASRDDLSLPSGSIRIADCLFRRVAAAVACETEGAVRLDFSETLHLGPGPLVKAPPLSSADESMGLELAGVTLRNAKSLLEFSQDRSTSTPGRVTIRADRSVFAPASGGALILFRGDGAPEPLLENLSWSGEGCLVTPTAPVAARQAGALAVERLDDSAAAIAGLVLSDVEFAAPSDLDPANSELLRWNAPLRTTDPPGCNVSRLPVCANSDQR
jgi:hypothetical protein